MMRLQLIVIRPGELPGLIVPATITSPVALITPSLPVSRPLAPISKVVVLMVLLLSDQRRRPARARRRRADADIAGVDDAAGVQREHACRARLTGDDQRAVGAGGGRVADVQRAAGEGGDAGPVVADARRRLTGRGREVDLRVVDGEHARAAARRTACRRGSGWPPPPGFEIVTTLPLVIVAAPVPPSRPIDRFGARERAGGLLAREVERRVVHRQRAEAACGPTDADGDRVDRGLVGHRERAGAAAADRRRSRSRRWR